MKKILIIEDQSDIRKLVRMTLEFDNYEIHEAADGDMGLKMIYAVRPDLVLLDVMMPGTLDGYQVCQRVKADMEVKHTPVILLTARGQVADREQGVAAGADEYLIKPFSPLQLIETIERILAAE